MFETKSNLSRLVEAVETGAEAEIIIARNGRPVARLVPIGSAPLGQRIGVARGAFVVPDSIDINNDEVENLFHGMLRRLRFCRRCIATPSIASILVAQALLEPLRLMTHDYGRRSSPATRSQLGGRTAARWVLRSACRSLLRAPGRA
jgi:prevent-host-death family protein